MKTGAPLTTRTGMLSKRLEVRHHAVARDAVVVVADLDVAGGDHGVAGLERLDDVDGRESVARQLVRVQVDHDLAELAAEDHRARPRPGTALIWLRTM